VALAATLTPDVVVTAILMEAAAVLALAGSASTGSSKLSNVESEGGSWVIRW